MSDQIKTYCFSSIMQDGVACTSPTLTVIGSTGLEVSCVKGTCVDFSLTEGAESHCITVQIDCHSCNCDPLIETKCFCEESGDCPTGCEFCSSDGICVSNCPAGQFCDDSTCADCLADGDCPCNQKCIQGHCQCENPGDVINNQGCCVDCVSNNDCGPCEVCLNGDCVPKDCGTGHCNPITGECDECYTDAHCGANECCVGGSCVCCEGFHQDPLTGLCVPTPECFTSEDCKDCEDCINYGCVPRVCPDPDQICVNDTCIDGCNGPEDCPLGYGCLNGECVPCSSLTCDGGVSLCQQAKGCECSGTQCVAVDCTVLDNCVIWDVVRPTSTPGTPIPGTGLPAVAFNVSWVDLGLVTMPGGGSFRNYRFTVTETSGAIGNFSVYGYSLGVGNSVSFELDDATPIQWNNVGFEIDFTEASPGSRTASIVILNQNWYSGGSGFQQDLFITPANWSYNVQASAIPPSTTGGTSTPGSLKLCACNPNAEIIGWDWNTIEGNLTVTFSQLPDGCLRAIVQGCGTGEGTVTIDCAGYVSTIPIPPLPFDYSSSTCCDPITDPTCSGNPDESTPCNTVDILQGTIVLSQFGSVTPSGAGVFRGVFQPSSVGISGFDWIRAARAGVCWSTTGTMVALTTFSIPSLPFSFQDVEYSLGAGCLRMGHTCSIRIGVCKEVQAEVCLSGCDAFVVDIVNNAGTLTAVTSMGNLSQLLFNWYENEAPSKTGVYPDYNADGNNRTYVMPNPNSTITFMTVNVQISINGQLCFAQDIERFTKDTILGCRNTDACNYNASATADAPCCFLENVSYSCTTGLLIPDVCPGVTYQVIASPSNITYSTPGLFLNPTIDHTIIGLVGGDEVCRTTIRPKQCYRCSGSDCVAAPTTSNFGEYDSPDCGFNCGCGLNIEVMPHCTNNLTSLEVWVNGGSGDYSISIQNDLGAELYSYPSVGNDVHVTSPAYCNTEFKVAVSDNNGIPGACEAATWHTSCFTCAASTTAIVATDLFNNIIQYSCDIQRFVFTLVPDSCATYYDVAIYDSDNVLVGTGHWGNLITNTFTSVGVDAACNGEYRVVLTDSNACSKEYIAAVNCTPPYCGDPIPSCPLNSAVFAPWYNYSAETYQILYQLQIEDGTPTHTYTMEVYNMSSCGGEKTGTPIFQQTFTAPGDPGTYEGFLSTSWSLPIVSTCYWVQVKANAPFSSDCVLGQIVQVLPAAPPATSCSIVSSNISSYSVANQRFTLSWNFANSTSNITVEATVWDSGTCGVGSSYVISHTGLASIENNHPVNIPQIDGVDQCVQFEIFDTGNPTCTTGLISRSLPSCTCSVTLTEVIYNELSTRLEIEWEASCATDPTEFLIEINERATIGCGGATTSLTTYTVTTLTGLQYYTMTVPGADRYIEVIITDTTNASCTASTCIVAEGCNACTTQFVDIPAARVNSLEDNNGNTYLIPSGVYFECVDTGDPSTVNDTAAAVLQAHLVSLGDCGTPIVTWASIVADGTTCTHSGITYAGLIGTGAIKYLGIDINGNTYSTDIVYANVAAGVPTLVAGVENVIETHVLNALTTEGIPFDNVQVSVTKPLVNSVKIEIVVQGIDLGEVLTAFYDYTATGGSQSDVFDAVGCADLGEDQTLGTCIRLTIAGSGTIFDNAVVANNTYIFDNSGC